MHGTQLRVEDNRLLTGRGNYVDNAHPENVSYLGILRSPYAHARIKSIDLSNIASSKDLIATLTGKQAASELDCVFETPGQKHTGRPHLAVDEVRFVGEGVVAIIARSRYAVEDLLDQILVEYEPLPLVSSIEDAKTANIRVYSDWKDNIALTKTVERGDADGAIAAATHVMKTTVGIRRQAGIPVEPRALLASYDAIAEKYQYYASVQSAHKFRSYLAKELKVPIESVRFVVKDVGGGFGTKGAQSYPEFALAGLLARKTGFAVKWVSTRTEELLESSPDRDQYCEIELACDASGSLTALRANIESDVGILGTFNISLPHTISLLPGAYRIPNVKITGTCYVTNKVPTGPVRGAGRPDSGFFIEFAIDSMARKIGMDPIEFRKKNVVKPEDFPYDNGAGMTYDSGNYSLMLETLARVSDYSGKREDHSGQDGRSKKLKGTGISLIVEDTGAQMFENATLLASKDGRVVIATGSSPHGQGLETTFAQLCAEELGISIGKISVVWGDTDLVPQGLGTFASRSISVGGSAVLQACKDLENLLLSKASELIQRSPSELKFEKGTVYDSKDNRDIIGFEELLSKIGDVKVESKFTLKALPVAAGAQLCELSIDTETGMVNLERLLVVDDCGRVINPSIVDGQIHGGLAHGIGGALYEEITYDKEGKPSATNLMDYLIPTANTIILPEVEHLETRSTVTLNGAKGVGESGTIGAYPSVFNALNDALSILGKTIHIAPARPEQLYELVKS